MSITRIGLGEWNSRAVIHNGIVYLSGMVADDKTLPMKEQTEQVLAHIDNFLAEAGSDKSKLLSAVVYLADMSKKDDMNVAWMAWVDADKLPARAAVGTALTPGTMVEIMVTAAI
jgi:enamine deaminase RidA (YjgF/YER057c/UK114 family)